MKISGALALILATAAFILSFLLIFAGNKPGVLTQPTYSIISVNTSQIGENIVRQVVDQYLDNPEKLLQLLNGLFASALGSALKGNSSGLSSILGGSGISLPSGILPSGVTIPTKLPSNLPSFTISIPTSIPTNLLSGLKPRDASPEPEASAEAQPQPVAEAQPQPVPAALDLESASFSKAEAVPSQAELIARSPFDHDLLLRAVGGDLQKRDLITDILGSLGSSTFKNFSLAQLPIAQELANQIINKFANQIGIYDFYDFHVLKYCLGNYYPTDEANATVPLSAIHRNVSQCDSYGGLDLKRSVSSLLNESGFAGQGNISLSTINFPDNLDSYITLAKKLLKAITALYAITIGMAFFIMVLSVVAMFGSGREAGLGTCISVFAIVGLIASLVASIIVTAAGSLISKKIGDLGNQLGLSYQIGSGMLGMTWATFGCMFIIAILACFVCCSGRHRNRRNKRNSKMAEMEKTEKRGSYT